MNAPTLQAESLRQDGVARVFAFGWWFTTRLGGT
jgi:hypothetical protein